MAGFSSHVLPRRTKISGESPTTRSSGGEEIAAFINDEITVLTMVYQINELLKVWGILFLKL